MASPLNVLGGISPLNSHLLFLFLSPAGRPRGPVRPYRFDHAQPLPLTHEGENNSRVPTSTPRHALLPSPNAFSNGPPFPKAWPMCAIFIILQIQKFARHGMTSRTQLTNIAGALVFLIPRPDKDNMHCEKVRIQIDGNKPRCDMGKIGETVWAGRKPSPKFKANHREYPPTLPDRDADSDPSKHAEKGYFPPTKSQKH